MVSQSVSSSCPGKRHRQLELQNCRSSAVAENRSNRPFASARLVSDHGSYVRYSRRMPIQPMVCEESEHSVRIVPLADSSFSHIKDLRHVRPTSAGVPRADRDPQPTRSRQRSAHDAQWHCRFALRSSWQLMQFGGIACKCAVIRIDHLGWERYLFSNV